MTAVCVLNCVRFGTQYRVLGIVHFLEIKQEDSFHTPLFHTHPRTYIYISMCPHLVVEIVMN